MIFLKKNASMLGLRKKEFCWQTLAVFGFSLLLLCIIVLYARHFIILGGEGNYFLDINLVKNFYRYTWYMQGGTGAVMPLMQFSFGLFDVIGLVQGIGFSSQAIHVFSIFLIYCLPFLSILFLFYLVLKTKFWVAFLVALFYVFNPISTMHLQSMMFWNVAPLVVMPLLFAIIYRYYFESSRLFFVFGIAVVIMSASFSNIPYLGIFQIFLLMSLVIVSFLRVNNFGYKRILKNACILEVSFILFSAWWLIPLARSVIQDQQIASFRDFALNWVLQYSTTNVEIISKILSLRTLVSHEPGYFFSDYYFNGLVGIILYIPIAILIAGFILRKDVEDKRLMVVTFFLLIVIFLNKGVNHPFGGIYLWMLQHLPYFIIFKTPLEKFSVLFIFLFALALVLFLRSNMRGRKIIWTAFGLYLLVCSIPYLALHFMPDEKIAGGQYLSRKFIDKPEYQSARVLINNEKLDYRLLSLPGSLNYQVTMFNHDDKYYRGMDPIMYALNKAFIAAYSGPQVVSLYQNIDQQRIENLLSSYNVGKVMINRDIVSSFGFLEKVTTTKIDDLFSKKMKKWTQGAITLFTSRVFLPHLYIPTSVIISTESSEILPRIVLASDYQIRSAVYFQDGISATLSAYKRLVDFKNNSVSGVLEKYSPTMEFKKINATKYRVIVHHAPSVVPIVFSETYHDGWKVYLKPRAVVPTILRTSDQLLKEYKILDGNTDSQATVSEVKDFINAGLITSLGDGKQKEIKHTKWGKDVERLDYLEKYAIDFISKNFQGSIQNDNLSDGVFYETWFQKPVDNSNHVTVNGYANSWLLDVNVLCAGDSVSALSSLCTKNSDGTYDFELVVEFWPQRLVYIGILVSSFSLIFGLCAVYISVRGQKVSVKSD